MALIDHSDSDWGLSEKARFDRARHNQKVDKAIREAARNVLAEENIITDRGKKTVKIPIRGLKEWRFVHRRTGAARSGGLGQGEGQPGDIIWRRPLDDGGSGPGSGGNQIGDDLIEVEVEIDYLINIMFEELGLPFLEKKEIVHKYVTSGIKIESISKTGIQPLIHKKRTYKEAIKRFSGEVREIMEATDLSEEDAKLALRQANYDLEQALILIKSGQLLDKSADLEIAVPMISDTDLRYKEVDEKLVPQSQCVIIAIGDSSGSMTPDKKFLLRSFFFWFVEFLKTKYEFVEIRFIIHTTDSKIVDEETFFKKSESGGTYPYTGIEKAKYLIETEYPLNQWNAYVVYCGDGESFSIEQDLDHTDSLLKLGINMYSYIEVHPTEAPSWGNTDLFLIDEYIKRFSLEKHTIDGLLQEFYSNRDLKFYATIVTNRDGIWPALRFILFGDGKKVPL